MAENTIKLIAHGEDNIEGVLTGGGKAVVEFADLSKSTFKVDYTRDDELWLKFDQAVTVGVLDGARISGGIGRSLDTDKFTAHGGVELGISKSVAANIEYKYATKDGHKVTAGVTITW